MIERLAGNTAAAYQEGVARQDVDQTGLGTESEDNLHGMLASVEGQFLNKVASVLLCPISWPNSVQGLAGNSL